MLTRPVSRLSFHLQDAHEFLNYLLNKIGEDLEADEKERRNDASKKRSENGGANIDDCESVVVRAVHILSC